MKVNIYTDGSSLENPGPGGYGIILESGSYRKELGQGFRKTTNNRMELMAVVESLKALSKNGLEIHIFSDSKYVVDAVSKGWVFSWVKKRFKGKKNSDLWREFLKQYQKHRPKFHWIKGHNNHMQNERCDQLAVAAAASGDLKIDEGFEQQEKEKRLL